MCLFLTTDVCRLLLHNWLVLGNGSRLSAVRQAQIHAGCEILGIESLTEDSLYAAMDWLYDNKSEIEKRLFANWKKLFPNKKSANHIFLHDLSSSYLEGTKNELAAFGYNRDKKKGKMIITYGLLTDQDGDPLGIEVFPGNAADNKTVKTRIEKIKHGYQVEYVTFVVRKKERTIAHMVITMFAYKIERYLRNKWKEMDFTPMEGMEMLKQLGSQIISIGRKKQVTILKPTGVCKQLLDKVSVKMPELLPCKAVDVHTDIKLTTKRK